MSRSVDFLSRGSSTHSNAGLLPEASSILITDTVSSPALFLVTQLVARTLRANHTEGKGRVVLVGVSHAEQEYTNLLKKQSVQLNTEKSLGRFEFIDGSDDNLSSIYRTISESIHRGGGGTLVILDDLTAWSWMMDRDDRVDKVIKFQFALRKLCISTRSTLVSVLHSDSISPFPVVRDEPDQYLFRRVLQSSDYWFELKSLVSQARGELSIHPGPSLLPCSKSHENGERLKTRVGKEALEYTLEENGAVFEIKGLGKFI